VLVDLSTGTYLRLNVVAAEVCEALGGSDDLRAAAQRLALKLEGGEAAADRAIQEVTTGLRQLGPRREPSGAFRYVPRGSGGYLLMSNGAPRLSISDDGTAVQLVEEHGAPRPAQIYEYLRAIAPKLLFLQSKIVMHGAGSRTASGVRVISGESGAGKTTTARAFHAAGLELFAEDMLVVASISPLCVHDGGEEAITAWARRSSEQLAGSADAVVDASELESATKGRSVPVSNVWFIDGARRQPEGVDIRTRTLGETDGALALMTSLFLGSASPEAWRQFLALAGAVATSMAIEEALMPAGLDRLQSAAKRYTENSAS
jgi:hypothetical protein